MFIKDLLHQAKDNFLALFSILIAVLALIHSTTRSQTTEHNFNLRAASFEMLKNLGELQVIVNYAYYQPDSSYGNPVMGWGRIALIGDLSQLLPQPVPDSASKLITTWKQNWELLKTNEESVDHISEEITASRMAILEVLKHLD